MEKVIKTTAEGGSKGWQGKSWQHKQLEKGETEQQRDKIE